VVDVDPRSFEADIDDGDDPYSTMKQALTSAKTIFVNAVMGFMPHFWHGTSAMNEAIDQNASARKLLAGGDTLQEFKRLVTIDDESKMIV
jgi:phosphoglycerate kinase